MVMLSDGSLLVVFDELSLRGVIQGSLAGQLLATRCASNCAGTGAQWTKPVTVGFQGDSSVVDPANGTAYSTISTFSLAAAPSTGAVVAWTTNNGTKSGEIHVVSSSDGGSSWRLSTDLHRPAETFQAKVAVADDGAMALTWYDFSGPQPAGMVRPTTAWFARRDRGGSTWLVDPLASPFDLSTASASGFAAGYLGDYQGLVPTGKGFEAAFTLGRPSAQFGATDIFATALPAGHLQNAGRSSGGPSAGTLSGSPATGASSSPIRAQGTSPMTGALTKRAEVPLRTASLMVGPVPSPDGPGAPVTILGLFCFLAGYLMIRFAHRRVRTSTWPTSTR